MLQYIATFKKRQLAYFSFNVFCYEKMAIKSCKVLINFRPSKL